MVVERKSGSSGILDRQQGSTEYKVLAAAQHGRTYNCCRMVRSTDYSSKTGTRGAEVGHRRNGRAKEAGKQAQVRRVLGASSGVVVVGGFLRRGADWLRWLNKIGGWEGNGDGGKF